MVIHRISECAGPAGRTYSPRSRRLVAVMGRRTSRHGGCRRSEKQAGGGCIGEYRGPPSRPRVREERARGIGPGRLRIALGSVVKMVRLKGRAGRSGTRGPGAGLQCALREDKKDNEHRYRTPGPPMLAPADAAGAGRHPRRLGARRGRLAPHGLGRALGFQEPVLPVPALSRHRVGARRTAAVEPVPFQRPSRGCRSAIASLHADDAAFRLARAPALHGTLRCGDFRPPATGRSPSCRSLRAAAGILQARSPPPSSSCSAAPRRPGCSIPG